LISTTIRLHGGSGSKSALYIEVEKVMIKKWIEEKKEKVLWGNQGKGE